MTLCTFVRYDLTLTSKAGVHRSGECPLTRAHWTAGDMVQPPRDFKILLYLYYRIQCAFLRLKTSQSRKIIIFSFEMKELNVPRVQTGNINLKRALLNKDDAIQIYVGRQI